MKESASRINAGFLEIGAPAQAYSGAARTLVVLGAPRGGTSALAGVLHALGIFLGDNARAPVYEDLELASRMEREGRLAARGIIEDYNARYTIWGYKRPGLAFSISENHSLFRNPIYLVVFRDIFATANRNRISSHLKNEFTGKMRRVHESYAAITAFLNQQKPHALLCSYEKLLQDPAGYVDALIGIAGLEVTAQQRQAAIDCIEPAPSQYLEHARADRCYGALDRIEGNELLGWARYGSRFVRKPAAVEIYIDDSLVGRVEASEPKYPGCSYDGDAPDANCAFRYRLPAAPGQQRVRAKVSHEQHDLDNSPLLYDRTSLWRRLWARLT